MPFATCAFKGGSCKTGAFVQYQSAASCADAKWWPQEGPLASPSAVVYQSRDAFDQFGRMEVAASDAAVAGWVARVASGPAPILVPEVRTAAVRMLRAVPESWTARDTGSLRAFRGAAQPGEAFSFQIAVFAHSAAATVAAVRCSDLKPSSSSWAWATATIPASACRCLNLNGTNYWGQPYAAADAVRGVEVGRVLPLWLLVQLPLAATAAEYEGTVLVEWAGGGSQSSIALTLDVGGPVLQDAGDAEPWRGTRLAWLDSTRGLDDDTPPAPFTPLRLEKKAEAGLAATMLDKCLEVGEDGLLWSARVGTAANSSRGRLANAIAADVLASPVRVAVNGSAPAPLAFTLGTPTNFSAPWSARSRTPAADVQVDGRLDGTGYTELTLTLTHDGPVELTLSVPIAPAPGLMVMGLGHQGSYVAGLSPQPGPSDAVAWLVLDFLSPLSADALGIWSAADSEHEVQRISIATAPSAAGPWTSRAAWRAAEQDHASSMQVWKLAEGAVTSRYWRVLVIDVVGSFACAPAAACLPGVAEIQWRAAESGAWRENHYGRTVVVANSSGAATSAMPATQAVDGVYTFNIARHLGWDAALAPPTADPAVGPALAEPELLTDWVWDGINAGSAAWVGTSAAGLRLRLRGDPDEWQASAQYDSHASPPNDEVPWNNRGRGGIRLYRNGTLVAHTGVLPASGSTTTVLRCSLMLTPTRPLDLARHFGQRTAHTSQAQNYSDLRKDGATVAVLHQGGAPNPWINYPYRTDKLIASAAAGAHAAGMKLKVYNTMRELSTRCRELFALAALRETLLPTSSPRAGGPPTPPAVEVPASDWLSEHLQYDYQPAWSNPVSGLDNYAAEGWVPHTNEADAAVKVRGLSRWNNYYVEGLRWLGEKLGTDGIYLDEIAYDRVTMLRARRVLGVSGLIGHHSDSAHYATSSALNYLELYPFIDSLWYGEGFDYERASAVFWLCEMSGLPHGLTNELLRYGGQTPAHFKGMLFGSANRWQGPFDVPLGTSPFDPRAVWALWDRFGIDSAVMYGFWLDAERGAGTVPAVANDTGVKVTAFVRRGQATLLALASFVPRNLSVTLKVDWARLGLPASTPLVAPQLVPMQPARRVFADGEAIAVTAGQGWLLTLGLGEGAAAR